MTDEDLTEFKAWCEHYDLDPDDDEAREQYEEARAAFAALAGALGRALDSPG